MRVKQYIHDYFYSSFFKHFLMISNFILFTLISYISLSLDTRRPFNSINIILVALFIVVTIVYMIVSKSKPRINVFVICIMGLCICFLLSYVINDFEAFPKTPLLLAFFSLFVFLWLDSNKRFFNFYLFAFLIASWLFALTFIAFEFSSIIRPNLSRRIGVSLGNENDVARHLLFAFLINLYFVYASRNRLFKICFFTACILFAYLVILTESISNLLLLLASILVFVFYTTSKKAGLVVTLATFSLMGLAAILVFNLPALSSLKDRILSIFSALFKVGDERPDSSALSRFNAMINGFRLFFESPLFGNGANSVSNNYMIMAHNNIAEIGADFGVFALIFEEAIIIYPFIKDEKSTSKGKILTTLFGFYIFMIQFFLVVFNSKVESILLPLLFAATNEEFDILVYAKNKKEPKMQQNTKIKIVI